MRLRVLCTVRKEDTIIEREKKKVGSVCKGQDKNSAARRIYFKKL